MTWLGLKMLFGDRAKLLGILFGIAFAALLISQQASVFCGLMLLTTSQIKDIPDAELWVMDPDMENIDNIKPLRDTDLLRVRGVSEVEWAVPLFKGQGRARLRDGDFRTVTILGLDDATLVGAPRDLIAGSLDELRRPEAVIMDERGYKHLWPGEPIRLNRSFEMNDNRAELVGVCRVSQSFQAFPIIYTKYSRAIRFIPPRRKVLSFVLVRSDPDVSLDAATKAITEQTGLQALTREEFLWKTIWYYMEETGIPVNFGITVLLGFLVGTAIAGQTFYLFVIENLGQFATLKAMGTTNLRIAQIVLLQAFIVGLLGYGMGVGLAAGFGQFAREADRVAFHMPWQVLAGTGTAVLLIVIVASLLSIRRLLILDPAEVFRV